MISIYHDFSSDLKAVWDNLTSDSDSSPFLKFFLHKSWYELFGESKTLAVLNHSGDLLMPLILDNQNAEMTGGQDLFDYHDFIYKKELDSKKVKEVIDYCFSNLEVKKLKFKSIVEESLTHKLIISSCNELGLRVSSSHEDLSPYLDLKNSFDDYLMNLNKKNRHEIRSKMKRLKSAGNILIKQCSKNEVSDWIEIFFKLMTQNPEKETFELAPEQEKKDFDPFGRGYKKPCPLFEY